MSSTIPTTPYFLKNFLSKPVGSIPRVPVWSITFDAIPLDIIKKVNDYEVGFVKPLEDDVLAKLVGPILHTGQGCLFAQGITLPGDGMTANFEGTQQGGLFREAMNQGRDDIGKVKISFLDTSISFVEHVIRPWAVVTSFLGLVARKASYRTSINVYRWGLGNISKTPVIYQQWHFYGACPVNVSSEAIEYTVQSGFIRRDVEFSYQKYNYIPGPEGTSSFLT